MKPGLLKPLEQCKQPIFELVGKKGMVMRDFTQRKLNDLYSHKALLGTDGQLHDMDGVTQINMRQCDCLAELHKNLKPDLSIETGLAYGFSSLPILDVMFESNYGHHIAIDPGQKIYWHGVALVAIEELGFSDRFTWMGARSDCALPQLIAEGTKAQFIFFDGLHQFEAVITDLCLADQILDLGGLLVINDMWLPAIRAVASFIKNNMTSYESITPPHENIFLARKVRRDTRNWDHFIPFESSGDASTNTSRLFRKLFGG